MGNFRPDYVSLPGVFTPQVQVTLMPPVSTVTPFAIPAQTGTHPWPQTQANSGQIVFGIISLHKTFGR